MSDEEKHPDVPVIPMDEVDLLIGCGEVLLEEMLSRAAGIRRPPVLLQLLLADSPAYRRYAAPVGLTTEDFEETDDLSDRLLHGALSILERLRSEGSPLLGPHAIPSDHPVVLTLVACLAAHYFIEGNPCRFSDLKSIFNLFPSGLTGMKGLLTPVHALCQGPDALFTWSWRVSPFQIFRSEIGLTQRALDLLRFSELNPPTEPTEPRRGKWGFPEEGEDKKQPTILVLESKGLPKLADVALPQGLSEEMAFLAALLTQEPTAAPVMLFHGPPGTGKTLSAKALAGETGRPLGTTSIPTIMDKWIGESERKLAVTFSEATASGALLLIDEADALIQDRGRAYMSWQFTIVNSLLKLLEDTSVPVVLCSNFLASMDPALMRRVHHLLAFPLPGPKERRAIWVLELAHNGLGEGYDLDALAQVPLTGGLIRNAALQAARRGRILGNLFTLSTETLLELAAGEALKMTTGAEGHRVVGFGSAQARVPWEEAQDGVRLPDQRLQPVTGQRICSGGAA